MRVDGGEDFGGLCHAARSEFTASHVAVIRPDKMDTVGHQLLDIALRGAVGPHAHIHGGGDKDGLVGGNEERGGEIAREACAHFGQQIGGGGDHDQQVRVARQLDMADCSRIREIKEVRIDFVTR